MITNNKIKGIVKSVRRDCKGIKLYFQGEDGDYHEYWFSYLGKDASLVNSDLYGKEIEITIASYSENFKSFSYLRVLEQQTTKQDTVMGKEEYWGKKGLRDIEKDNRYSNGAALNTAWSIISSSNVDTKTLSPIALLEASKELAKSIKQWTELYESDEQ